MTLNVYCWDYIHRYFPPEIVELYRKQIIDERVSGLFTDKEIWERYGMSESTLYDFINRYSKEKKESLKDKTSTPINPSHKLGDEEIKIIIKKALEEKERIRTHQSNYEENMKKDGRSLSPKKLERIKKAMNRAKIGVRRIAHWFNSYMESLGNTIRIGKSRVYNILVSADIIKENKGIKKESKHLKRPDEPLKSFQMDFTQKRIGTGEKEYIFGLLDMHNDVFVSLTDHTEKNGDIVKENLQLLKEILPPKQKIEIRSDGGTEFNNKTVKEFCSNNNMQLHIIPKGSPWLQAFIERGFRTIKEEFLNLLWIGNRDKFKEVVKNTKSGYNQRPNSAFGYKSPLEVMGAKYSNLLRQVCGH
jgi:transposase InsO family protein